MAGYYWQLDSKDTYVLCRKGALSFLFGPHKTGILAKWEQKSGESLEIYVNDRPVVADQGFKTKYTTSGSARLPLESLAMGDSDQRDRRLRNFQARITKNNVMIESLWRATRAQVDASYKSAFADKLSDICEQLGYRTYHPKPAPKPVSQQHPPAASQNANVPPSK